MQCVARGVVDLTGFGMRLSSGQVLVVAAALGLLAACSSSPDPLAPDTSSAPETPQAPDRDEESQPAAPDTDEADEADEAAPDAETLEAATRRTTLVLEMPDGATEEQRDVAADSLAMRAQAIAPDASIDVDGDTLTVVLPGVADDDVGDRLVGDSVLSVGQVHETRTSDHPDWEGCAGEDGGLDDQMWVCDDDDTAHLVDIRWTLSRPSEVELSEQTLHLELADADTQLFAELTADLACERDTGRIGMLALLVGPKLLSAAGMNPAVECGQGITDGSVAITAGVDAPPDEFKQLAEALRTSFDVKPELHTIQVLEAASPWPRQRDLESQTVQASASLDTSIADATLQAQLELEVRDGQLPADAATIEWFVSRRVFDAAQLASECPEQEVGQGHGCLAATMAVELESGQADLAPVELDADWPTEHLVARLQLPDGTTTLFGHNHS